jgi:hypothetical protein
MSAIRHLLWRLVARNLEQFASATPDGHEAVVEVTVAGLVEPIVIGRVETSRDPDDRWTYLFSRTEQKALQPSDYMLIVPEEYVQAVALRFRRKGNRLAPGFVHSEIDRAEESSSAA